MAPEAPTAGFQILRRYYNICVNLVNSFYLHVPTSLCAVPITFSLCLSHAFELSYKIVSQNCFPQNSENLVRNRVSIFEFEIVEISRPRLRADFLIAPREVGAVFRATYSSIAFHPSLRSLGSSPRPMPPIPSSRRLRRPPRLDQDARLVCVRRPRRPVALACARVPLRPCPTAVAPLD